MTDIIYMYKVGPQSSVRPWNHLSNGYIVQDLDVKIGYLYKSRKEKYIPTYASIMDMTSENAKRLIFKSRREALSRIKELYRIVRIISSPNIETIVIVRKKEGQK